MKRVQGSMDAALLECISPIKNKWRVRWDFSSDDNSYMEEEFKYKPSLEEIKNLITSYCNDDVKQKILSGFSWKGYKVWLSTENQLNYKASHDLAVLKDGVNLPVTFKFGDEYAPDYHTFSTVEELSDFYSKAVEYINNTLSAGWLKKEQIKWELYQ